MKKKVLALCSALVMLTALLAGCGSTASSNASNASGAGSTATPTGDKSVVVNLTQEPPMMNSILTTTTGSMNVLRHIMDGLVRLDPKDEPIPAVAESWEISEDKMTYTFKLRQGMKWSNGEPVTAKDFVFAWDTFFTEETAAPYADTWAGLILGAVEKLHPNDNPMSDETKAKLDELGYTNGVGYMAVDDYTLKVSTTGPYDYFLSVLAFPNLFPVNEKAYTEIGATQYATEADLIVTNGAYKMTSWTHESNIVLEKVADYYDADAIKIDKITMEMISDSGTAFNSFLTGELDMIATNSEQSAQLRGQGTEVLSYDDGSNWYFEYNTLHKGLNNIKVRTALTLGVDAEAFVSTIVANQSTAAYSFVPSAIWNGRFTKEVGKLIDRPTSGDYSSAKALLEEGLAEEGLTLADFKPVLIADDTTTAAKYTAFFQEQWKTNLGLEINIEQMTYKNRIERMQNHDFDIVMAGWGPDYNDPMTFLDLFVTGSGNNHTSYSNPDYDKLVADAMAETDSAKREAIMVEIEKLLMAEMPVGPIYFRAIDYVCSDRLTGVVRTAFTDMDLRWAEVK